MDNKYRKMFFKLMEANINKKPFDYGLAIVELNRGLFNRPNDNEMQGLLLAYKQETLRIEPLTRPLPGTVQVAAPIFEEMLAEKAAQKKATTRRVSGVRNESRYSNNYGSTTSSMHSPKLQ